MSTYKYPLMLTALPPCVHPEPAFAAPLSSAPSPSEACAAPVLVGTPARPFCVLGEKESELIGDGLHTEDVRLRKAREAKLE